MEGPQCCFSLNLVNETMTQKELITFFHFVKSNENSDKRNLLSFFFTFSEYKTEKKKC